MGLHELVGAVAHVDDSAAEVLELVHNSVTPFKRGNRPMKLPNAAALLVALWNAFTASSLLP